MRGFFSRWKVGLRRQLLRKSNWTWRFVGLLYVLVALAGFDLVAFAPTPRLTLATVGFLVLPAGLLFSGSADLTAKSSSGTRVALRSWVPGF